MVSINLAHVSLSAEGDVDKFFELLEERLDLVFRATMIKHNRLRGVKANVAPILWQHGALARLNAEDTIDDLLLNGYSSVSLGYAGLYESVLALTGLNHAKEGKDFGIKIMEFLNKKCEEWKQNTNIGFSTYGVPQESTTLKFAKALQRDFGVIKNISDKDYVMNSYHVDIKEKIDAFSKISIEGEYQKLSLGGAISYIETPNMQNNVEAVLDVIKYIYDNIMYAEINSTSSYCHVCGGTDIKMEKDLKFHCPSCGNADFNKMNVAVRVCGYISTNEFNEGRAEDIFNRVYHLGCD